MSDMDQTLVTRIVEAALLAANQPLTVVQLHALFPLDEPAPEGSVETALGTWLSVMEQVGLLKQVTAITDPTSAALAEQRRARRARRNTKPDLDF